MPELKHEQKVAVSHDNGNIMVSASAGSGKTFVMIERIIRLIKEGKAQVNQILAVTFTETAASDMKEKLKKALIEQINDGNEILSSQLLDVSSADISTLHSFCSRLIRTYFFVTDVSPDYKIIDESEADQLKAQALNVTFSKLYEQNAPMFKAFRQRYSTSRSDRELKELVLEIFEKCESEVDPKVMMTLHRQTYQNGLKQVYDRAIEFRKREFLGMKNTLESILSDFVEEDSQKGIAFTQDVIGDIDLLIKNSFENSKDFLKYKQIRKASFESLTSPRFINAKTVAVSIRDAILLAVTTLSKLVEEKANEEIQAQVLTEETDALMQIVQSFAQNYAKLKREENALDFADLEHYVLQILSDEQILADIRARYKYVFVDEYQDVNGVQEEIITKISNDNLFMVGDVKQSIYGFRGCNPDIFENKFNRMQSQKESTVNLNFNFRSANNVISMVNKIFCYSMTKGFYGTDYKDNAELKAGGIFPDGADGRACLHLLLPEQSDKPKKEKEEIKVYKLLENINNQAKNNDSRVASLVTNIIKEELGKTYYNPKEKKYLPVSYKDIVILTRNKENSYVSGLVTGLMKYGIPVTSEVKQNVCEFAEVILLINLLKLVDCFKQDIPLATIMKSPFGAFTDEELAEIAIFYNDNKTEWDKNAGFYNAYITYLEKANTPLALKLKDFDKRISDLRYLSDFIGAKGVLEKFISDCDYQAYLLASDLGEQKLDRVKFFVSQACNGKNTLTVSEMLNKVERSEKSFEYALSSDEETLRVMTIHASKGLEFPVVIVCGLERKTGGKEKQFAVRYDRELGFALQMFDDKLKTKKDTFLRLIMKERERENRLKEELRLLYVALTRPSYALHMTVEGEEMDFRNQFYGATKFTDYIPQGVENRLYNDGFEFMNLTAEPRKVLVGKPDEQVKDKIKELIEFNYQYLSDCSLPLKTNVTGVLDKGEIQEQPVYRIDFSNGTDKEKGTLAHKFLEHYDFNGKGFLGQVQDLLDNGVMTNEQLNSFSLEKIENALKNPVFSTIKNAKLYREQGFICAMPASTVLGVDTTEQVLVQGIIDLLAIDDDGASIIDYKYSSLSSESLKNRYSKQLELYSIAVQKALKVPVKEKILVNIYSGEVVKV